MSSSPPADNTQNNPLGTNHNTPTGPQNLNIPSSSIPPIPFPDLQLPTHQIWVLSPNQPASSKEALIKNISTQIALMLNNLIKDDNFGIPNSGQQPITPSVATQKETRKETVEESSTSIPALDEDMITPKIEQVIQKTRMGPRKEEERVLEAIIPFISRINQTEMPTKFKLPQLEQFDGTGDPISHVSSFRIKMMLQNVN